MTPPILSRELVLSARSETRSDVRFPAPGLLDLPERVVQFGTGALLRGLVEPLVDDANVRGEFGGRIVMVGQTGSGRDRAVNRQDGLFTLVARGLVDGEPRSERRVVASVSRALSAVDEWDAVLACARDPQIALIFSNTTEIGIVLDEKDSAEANPPRSFPGKLTRFLWERTKAFGFDPARGVVVLPCELVTDNGAVLRDLVLRLARLWGLGDDFERWVASSVPFCNTLVDRIVPGTPAAHEHAAEEAELGYADALLTVSEDYALFAIEAGAGVRERLPFAGDPRVVIVDDISPYRERKLRLLNGTHTAMTPVALLCGCQTVLDAVEDAQVGAFIRRVMLDEIAPFVAAPEAETFAREVLDRFANPFIRHEIADIALQQTMKLRVRIVPSVLAFARETGMVPASLAFAFAAYLRWMRGDGEGAQARDDQGAAIRALWQELGDDPASIARRACADTATWGAGLAAVPGFADAVAGYLVRMMAIGTPAALAQHLARAAAHEPRPAAAVGG
ncbi:MAG TPA: tagaturonate reductase [Longimicrobium sp.]|nr:tagaturonate reductase [Longimicrobium sp.]